MRLRFASASPLPLFSLPSLPIRGVCKCWKESSTVTRGSMFDNGSRQRARQTSRQTSRHFAAPVTRTLPKFGCLSCPLAHAIAPSTWSKRQRVMALGRAGSRLSLAALHRMPLPLLRLNRLGYPRCFWIHNFLESFSRKLLRLRNYNEFFTTIAAARLNDQGCDNTG